MNPFSRLDLSHRLQNAFHGAPAAEVRDDALRQWLDTQNKLSRTESKAVARALNDAFTQRSARVDLSHLSPQAIDALPDALIQRMAPHADQLTLPVGCHPETVMRWIEPLNLSKLTAYGMTGNTPSWRDDQLPERLTMICSDRLPVPESDLVGTHRLYDIRDRHVAAHVDARPRHGDAGAAPVIANSLQDYIDAACIAHDFVQWSAERPKGEQATTMSPEAAVSLKQTLSRIDVHLLAPKAREACRLVRHWLDESPKPRISPTRASQLALVSIAMARAFTADTISGPALANGHQLARLQKRLLWIDEAPDLHTRTDREGLLSLELDRRAPELLSSRSTSPRRATSAADRSGDSGGSVDSADSGFASGGWSPEEVAYVNTPRPPRIYTEVDYVDMSGGRAASRPFDPSLPWGRSSPTQTGADYVDMRAGGVASPREPRPAAVLDRPSRARGPLPGAGAVDAAETALRPLRRALGLNAGGTPPRLTLAQDQRAKLSEALRQTADVLPAQLAPARARVTHCLQDHGPDPIELTKAQARDLLVVFDTLRELSSQHRGDDARPALPERPSRPAA